MCLALGREREREKRALCFLHPLTSKFSRATGVILLLFFFLNRPPCRHLTIFSAASYQSAHLCVRGRTNNTRSPSLSNYFHPPGPVFPTYDRRRTLRRGFNTLSVGYRFCEYASTVLQGTQIHHSKCPAMWNIGPLSTHTREKRSSLTDRPTHSDNDNRPAILLSLILSVSYMRRSYFSISQLGH